MVSAVCEHGVRKDRCERCAKLCDHGKLKEKCSQCSKCEHGVRKSICAQCLPPESRCVHEKHPKTCRECMFERKRKHDEDNVMKNELDYFYEREFKRAVHSLRKHPEKLQKMHKDLLEQGIVGIKVLEVHEGGRSMYLDVLFTPTTV